MPGPTGTDQLTDGHPLPDHRPHPDAVELHPHPVGTRRAPLQTHDQLARAGLVDVRHPHGLRDRGGW